MTNFGGSNINWPDACRRRGPFSETNNCPAVLVPAASCTVSVTFTPTATGAASGTISVSDDSYNLGPSQTLVLSGTGTTPAATVTPASLSFSSQVIGTSSTARNVTVQSSGTGPLAGHQRRGHRAVQPDEHLQREHRPGGIVHHRRRLLADRGGLRFGSPDDYAITPARRRSI